MEQAEATTCARQENPVVIMATDNKYDRQLRLWGSAGQKALMEANILLVNAGATGTETLKNLVLPGNILATCRVKQHSYTTCRIHASIETDTFKQLFRGILC